MSRSGPSPALPPPEVLDLLLRLAPRGVRLRSSARETILVREASNRIRRRTPTAEDSAVVQAARAAGYLVVDPLKPNGPCEVLSPLGRSVVRGALVGTHAPERSSRQFRSGSKRVGRPLERRSQLEQIAARRDVRGRPLLTEPQVEAGFRLQRDFARAGLQPRVTAAWSPTSGRERRRRGATGAGVELATGVVAARDRLHAICSSLGRDLADIALDVCCFERGLEAVEAARGWPRGTARIVLQIAMSKVALYYGLLAAEPPNADGVLLRHWGVDDYKPSVSGPPKTTDQPQPPDAVDDGHEGGEEWRKP